MAANRYLSVGPVALTSTLTTNIFNPFITTLTGGTGYTQTQPYAIIRHIRIVNKHASIAATATLYKGLTGANTAGTEFVFFNAPVQLQSFIEAFGLWRFESTDFLVGGSNTATALTIELEGEIGLT